MDGDQTLMEQGIRNSAVVMVILLADTEAIRIVAEQKRMLEQTRADAERLSGRDSNKDDYFLQVILVYHWSILLILVSHWSILL